MREKSILGLMNTEYIWSRVPLSVSLPILSGTRHSPDKSKYLTRLRRFQRVQGFIALVDYLLRGIFRLGSEASVEALKNIVDSLTTNDKQSYSSP